ncbi:MAG TPA: AtpZ/AtpI family protein [Tepidisphaeraceae bacterium]|nr:AtpZ/AtpI family protein [Tepidisphaeraceae bacterium]
MARDDDSDWGRNLALGMEVAVGVGIGYFIGHWADKRFGWAPWGVYAGVMLGCAAGMYSLIKESVRSNKR